MTGMKHVGSVKERKNGSAPGRQAVTNKQETTMTSSYLDRASHWCFTLRRLMGYPGYAPARHTTVWCSSSPRDPAQVAEVMQIVADMGRDLVHVSFVLDQEDPLGVSLAIQGLAGVEWMPDVRLYAASESAPIELLSEDRRWFIGPRLLLTGAKLPPKARRSKGEQIAWRRWRQAVATTTRPTLTGSVWVPPGGNIVTALPHELINEA
jgi:hypothetical protein